MSVASSERVIQPYGDCAPTFQYRRDHWPSPVAEVSVKVVYAVFEDGTAVGDESRIAGAFRYRAGDARVLRRVSDALSGIAGGDSGRAALERALTVLGFPDEGTTGDTHATMARRNVSMALERIAAGRMTASEAEAFLRHLQEDATIRALAAAKHAVRRSR